MIIFPFNPISILYSPKKFNRFKLSLFHLYERHIKTTDLKKIEI